MENNKQSNEYLFDYRHVKELIESKEKKEKKYRKRLFIFTLIPFALALGVASYLYKTSETVLFRENDMLSTQLESTKQSEIQSRNSAIGYKGKYLRILSESKHHMDSINEVLVRTKAELTEYVIKNLKDTIKILESNSALKDMKSKKTIDSLKAVIKNKTEQLDNILKGKNVAIASDTIVKQINKSIIEYTIGTTNTTITKTVVKNASGPPIIYQKSSFKFGGAMYLKDGNEINEDSYNQYIKSAIQKTSKL